MPDNPDLPEEYLCEIGRIAVNWNRLESALHHTLVIALLGGFATDGRAIAVFAHMAFPQKLDALSAMLRIIDEDLAFVYREQVQGLLKLAQEKRNTTLHQSWFSQEDGIKRFDVKARGKLTFTLLPVSIQELKEASLSIDNAYSKLLLAVTFPLAPKAEPQHG